MQEKKEKVKGAKKKLGVNTDVRIEKVPINNTYK